ncbi:MAG: adenylyltransferase [Alphaproteobacteria bacterium CG11_big_fil_rev_8_21_14_0_20_44_7]|nr:MAG: adenylyltransferase [Alphaproteobacteria bacterium CG11_big_fil_rev_8_21_14_0_20_44_7]
MEFDENQKLRYARNMILPEIGKAGQEKLLAAKVLIIGAGGLGSPVALYLAAAGVGKIGIVDDDKIQISNLQRQILYDTYYLNRPKVEIAKEKLEELNSDVKVEGFDLRLDERNASQIIDKYDIIADCTDNFDTRFLVNDVCMELGRTLVSAAIAGFEGQLYTFKKGKCNYRDIYDKPPEGLIPSCSQAGILGSVCGVMGSLQATEIIKELLGIGERLCGNMLVYNALNSSFRKISID